MKQSTEDILEQLEQLPFFDRLEVYGLIIFKWLKMRVRQWGQR